MFVSAEVGVENNSGETTDSSGSLIERLLDIKSINKL